MGGKSNSGGEDINDQSGSWFMLGTDFFIGLRYEQ